MATIKETIVTMFKLDQLPPDKMMEMVERLGKLVFQSVLVRSLPLLSEEELVEYEKIVDEKKGGEVLFAFLKDKIPDFEKIISEESELLRAELAGEFQKTGI